MRGALPVIPIVVGASVGIAVHSPGVGFATCYLTLLLEVLAWVAKRQWSRRDWVNATMRRIDAMGGVEFEDYVATRLGQAGWRVRFTPPVGDYGVDLIAERDGRYVAIQCKRYGKSVGVAAVQQVVSGALHHGCAKSIVVSNQEFTAAAKQLAYTHGCQLIGRKVLQTWVPPPCPTPRRARG
ncbi:MAG: restriction endonuclease [Mycobacterium sp.]|uniref:restriction endonuclease n=1 Tax=Mycobacterium sp. TaxID=1785 RepID=UPI001EBCD419|nr:restriction endonuclease [Mycobacterium sp.]MBW0019535.1 restriction endonuclease [Mycobacterium sp.]